MMRILICLLALTTPVLAQATAKDGQKQQSASPGPAAQSKPTPPSLLKRDETPAATVPPNQPVLTIRGVCPAETAASRSGAVPATKDCVTTLTKEQFDGLLNAFNPTNQAISPAQRRQAGQGYVELLAFSEAAKAAGVENSPAFVEVMRVIRMKTLSDIYRSQLAEQFRNPSQQEIEDYYKNNEAKYEGAKLSRIYLPKSDPNPQAKPEQKEAYQKKVQQLADDMQARAAKGEEMEKLQKESYTALGITAPPPNTDISMARHGIFPPKLDQEIFSHKAGEVFRSDDGTGYMIYRVDSRQTIPLDTVKDEIAREIARHKMEEKMKELNAPVHAEFNESYFGPPLPAAPAGRPAPAPAR